MSWYEVKDRILPVLRGTSSPEQAWRAAAIDPARALVRQRFVPFLHALAVVDHPDHIRYVSRGDLEDWGVSGDEVFDVALRNLPPSEGLVQRPDDGLWQLRSRDGYAASRLLLPRWLPAFEDQVGGRPVAAVPHARFLVVGGEDDVEKLLLVAKAGYAEAGTPISPALYTTGPNGVVVPYVPPPDHPYRVQVENAHKMLLQVEYERQRQALSELSDDAVLARTGLLDHGGRLVSVCAWTEGTPTLLPLTELVVLHPREGDAMWVPRVLLDQVAGDCLQGLPGVEPPRFRTLDWPARDALAKLKAGSLAVTG